MPNRETSPSSSQALNPPDPSEAAPPRDLRAELELREIEVLRLRDLLIAKDAELGSLKGQVAAMEAGTARVLSLLRRVQALVPGPFVRALLRRLPR
jgi:hypothetical protein